MERAGALGADRPVHHQLNGLNLSKLQDIVEDREA